MKLIWQKWQTQIENLLLENQFGKPPIDFDREDNFEKLQIPNSEEINDFQEEMIILFSRLSLCYEYGMFFEQISAIPEPPSNLISTNPPLINNQYALLFGFDHGHVFSFEDRKIVQLPQPTPKKVQKLKSLDWFVKWDIKGLGEQKDFTHLLLYPWPQMALILSTKLADPWLVSHIEKTLEYLTKASSK